MRKLIWLISFLLVISLGIGIYNWTHSRPKKPTSQEILEKKKLEGQALNLTQLYLNQGRPDDALQIIRSYDQFTTSATTNGRRWLKYLIEASTQLQDNGQLSALWGYYPQAFKDNEKAILMLARYMISTGRYDEYQNIKRSWEEKISLKDDWFLLEVDALAAQGDRKQALQLLSSQHLEGKKDAERLLRLAVEKAKDNPQEAWKNLNEAVALNPENSVVHLYRARFLEAADKDENALAEYMTLVQLEPQSLMLKNQLADFLLRHERYDEALLVLKEMLPPPTSDYAWLKVFFWNKVIKPLPYEWNAHSIPQGTLTPLLKYLVSLPKNVYWDESLFLKLTDANHYLKTEQETLWLRLIQQFADKKEKEALELLQANTFSQFSYLPQLEKGLLQILSFRTKQTLSINKAIPINPLIENREKNSADIDFFKGLNSAAQGESQLPAPLKSLITSEEAFAAAFLAAGWKEAAVALHSLDVYPDTFPLWMTLRMGDAIHQIQGPNKALTFLKQQQQNDGIQLLQAEIYIAMKKTDEAIPILLSVKNHKNIAGKTALKILVDLYLSKNDDKKAEEILNARKDLSEETFWLEAYANIALQRKDLAQAEHIYKRLINKSAEAKSYFARKAYQEGDLNQAQKLTVELIREYPMNPVLRNNLEDILQKQQKS